VWPVNVKINDPGAKVVFVVVVNEQVQRSNRAESKIFILYSQDKICNDSNKIRNNFIHFFKLKLISLNASKQKSHFHAFFCV